MQAQDVVVVGRIGTPYGVRGWVRITSFTEPADNLAYYRPWVLDTGTGWRAGQPVELKPHKEGYVARFADVDDRDAAAALAGGLIGVARTELPALAADEYYWRDLEGLTVWNRGSSIGVVDHLIDTGANPVLVICAASGGQPAETLIPFVAQFVHSVDLDAGRINVDWVGWDEAE